MLTSPLPLARWAILGSLVLCDRAAAQTRLGTGAAEVVARYRAVRAATMEERADASSVEAVLQLLTDSAVYEHPQAGARIVGRARIGEGMRQFLGATRNPRITVLREIVTGNAVASEERVTFEGRGRA
jgi:hypothetical protein